MQPVRGYPTGSGTVVEPLYRLSKGGSHDEGCKYDFDAQVGELRDAHVGVVEREGDIYVLVLNSAPDDHSENRSDEVGQPRSRVEFKQRPSERLRQSLRAATEIARLLRSFDDDPDARKRFRARYDGRTITWDEFCFDATRDIKRFHRALDQVDSGNHPRALVGRIETVTVADSGMSAAYLAVRAPNTASRAPVKAEDDGPISPVLRAHMAGGLRVDEGDDILAYGNWKIFNPDTSSRHYVTLWLDDHRGAVAILKRR